LPTLLVAKALSCRRMRLIELLLGIVAVQVVVCVEVVGVAGVIGVGVVLVEHGV
jgi:hypothetical protein